MVATVILHTLNSLVLSAFVVLYWCQGADQEASGIESKGRGEKVKERRDEMEGVDGEYERGRDGTNEWMDGSSKRKGEIARVRGGRGAPERASDTEEGRDSANGIFYVTDS